MFWNAKKIKKKDEKVFWGCVWRQSLVLISLSHLFRPAWSYCFCRMLERVVPSNKATIPSP
jgi:hypothetical protein